MAKWSTSPAACIDGTVLEWVLEDPDDAGFFHVTPFAQQVIECGALKARCDVVAMGLGGGCGNVAPTLVSTTVSLNRALWIAHGMRIMSKAAHGLLAPHEALSEMLEWSEMDWYGIEESADAHGRLDALESDFGDLEAMMRLSDQGPAIPTA